MRLTKKEEQWLDEFQELMNRCPSKRFSSFTTGDPEIVIFEASKEREVNDLLDSGDVNDFHQGVNCTGCEIERITMPFVVNSTAG